LGSGNTAINALSGITIAKNNKNTIEAVRGGFGHTLNNLIRSFYSLSI